MSRKNSQVRVALEQQGVRRGVDADLRKLHRGREQQQGEGHQHGSRMAQDKAFV
jgi:hypothetical protein